MESESRVQSRSEITCDGHFRTEGGIKGRAILYDISRGGCSFRDLDHLAIEGRRLKIWLGNVGPFDGVVQWIKDRSVGMEFDKPLYEPVYEHLRSALSWNEATQGRRS